MFFECDYKRFDGSIVAGLLRCEQEVYCYLLDDDRSTILEVFKPQLHRHGVTQFGHKFSHVGRRGSGDANTSIGNWIINRFICWLALEGKHTWASVHEGDDGFVGATSATGVAEDLTRTARAFGLELIVRAADLPGLGFCGRHYYQDPDGELQSHCDIPRALRKLHLSHNSMAKHSADARRELARMKAMSYLATDPEVPVLSSLCRAIIRCTAPTRLRIGDQDAARRMHLAREDSPRGALASACVLYGWSPGEVSAFENWYDSWRQIPKQPIQIPIPLEGVYSDDFKIHPLSGSQFNDRCARDAGRNAN